MAKKPPTVPPVLYGDAHDGLLDPQKWTPFERATMSEERHQELAERRSPWWPPQIRALQAAEDKTFRAAEDKTFRAAEDR
jgi:hypothetical protein